MKIIQVSDLHLTDGALFYGIDPLDRIGAFIESVKQEHGDAALVVATGDLAHGGDGQAYRLLKTALAKLPMPTALLVGNHDRREAFRSVFADAPVDRYGFVQWTLRIGELRLIGIDTARRDGANGAGTFCTDRAVWLQDQLLADPGRPTLLFAHHPPMSVGIEVQDTSRVHFSQHTIDALKQANLLGLFCGHVHRSIDAVWQGLTVSICGALVHAVGFDPVANGESLVLTDEPPSYSAILVNGTDLVVHRAYPVGTHRIGSFSPRSDTSRT
ncbi:MAG: metallophosphoesterase [Pseudomonadota bacterium]